MPELAHGHESKREASIKDGLFHEHKEGETQSPETLGTDSRDGDHFCPTPTSASAFHLASHPLILILHQIPDLITQPQTEVGSQEHTCSELPPVWLPSQWQTSNVILGHATHHVSRTSVLYLVSGLIQILGDCKGRPDGHRPKAGS